LPEPRTFRRRLRTLFSRNLSFLLVAAFFVLYTPVARPQQTEITSKFARKLISQVTPAYPPDLKRAAIGGVVKMEIVVAPGGKVDSVIVTGGNPILAESAERAVKQWKYAPSFQPTNMKVNVRFDPTH
jgi:TonB family protein